MRSFTRVGSHMYSQGGALMQENKDGKDQQTWPFPIRPCASSYLNKALAAIGFSAFERSTRQQ